MTRSAAATISPLPSRRSRPKPSTPEALASKRQKKGLRETGALFVSEPLVRRTAGEAEAAGRGAAAAPDRRRRNARRNKGSRGSTAHRRSESQARPDGP